MTDREKAIVMAYTGICMLEGEKMGVFYQYLEELYDRSVYTHEWAALDMKEKSKPDFLQLCKEEQPERKKGRWYDVGSLSCRCSECGCKSPKEYSYCPNCGADMRGE